MYLVVVADADDDVVTIDDDTGEASMMRMMGFSDFNSTKVNLRNLKMMETTVTFDLNVIDAVFSNL